MPERDSTIATISTPEQRRERRERFLRMLMPVQRKLECYAFAVARDKEDAFDLVGETILRAYEHMDSIKSEQAFPAYLFTIASRLNTRRRWRGRIFGQFEQEYAEALPSGGALPDAAVDVQFLYGALARLPAKQREALVLFEISGFSLNEIREIQGGSLSGVKMRLKRARLTLATLLGADESSEPRSVRLANLPATDPAPDESYGIHLHSIMR